MNVDIVVWIFEILFLMRLWEIWFIVIVSFEWDINFIGVICFIFFVCGRMKCVVFVVMKIKNFFRYMYLYVLYWKCIVYDWRDVLMYCIGII